MGEVKFFDTKLNPATEIFRIPDEKAAQLYLFQNYSTEKLTRILGPVVDFSDLGMKVWSVQSFGRGGIDQDTHELTYDASGVLGASSSYLTDNGVLFSMGVGQGAESAKQAYEQALETLRAQP